MFAKTAKIDLERLRSAGYEPTDEEVIRLNDIAVCIESGKETTVVNMPRVAYAGSVTLHEPTIGAIEWWHNYGRDAAWSTQGKMNTHFFMLAHAKDIELLNRLTRPSDIRNAVKSWMKTVDATDGELWRALLWVKAGQDIGEVGEVKLGDSATDDEVMDKLWMTVIAAAGALGVVPDDLKTSTQSELVALLVQANLHARIPMKQSVAKDYIAYRQVMKQIEDRGKKNG